MKNQVISMISDSMEEHGHAEEIYDRCGCMPELDYGHDCYFDHADDDDGCSALYSALIKHGNNTGLEYKESCTEYCDHACHGGDMDCYSQCCQSCGGCFG